MHKKTLQKPEPGKKLTKAGLIIVRNHGLVSLVINEGLLFENKGQYIFESIC